MRFRKARSVSAWLVALAVAVVATGCGSRLTHQQLLADARGGTTSQSALGSGASNTTGLNGSESGSLGATTAGPGGGAGSASALPGAAATGSGASAASGGGSSGQSASAAGGGSVAAGASAAAAGSQCSGTKATINIGSVGAQSGIFGQVVAQGPKTVQAWLQWMNSRGGLYCHPLRYFVADDGADPSRHQALVQQMVEQNHVIAFVQMDAPLEGQASVSYLEQKQIPVIGTETGSPWVYTSPMYFPQASSDVNLITSAFAAAGQLGKAQGKSRVGTVSCIEAQICSNLYNVAPDATARFGDALVYRGRASLAQPDFTSVCQAAANAGTQLFLTALDANSMERMTRSCNGVNFHPVYALYTFSVNPVVMADPQLEGAVLGTTVIPVSSTANPSVATYLTVMRSYAAAVPQDSMSMTGWVSTQLFQLAARNVGDAPTSQALLNGLWSIKNDDLGGITQPLSFTKGQTAPQMVCYWLLELKSGHFVSPNNGQRTCL